MTLDPSSRELALRVLLAEKDYLDGRITAVLDLQTKINGIVLPALTLAGGWVVAGPNHSVVNPALRSVGLLAIVAVFCAVNLQTVINWLIGVGNIHQKIIILEGRMRSVLDLPDQPLITFNGWATGPIRSSLGLAGLLLSILQTSLCVFALLVAYENTQGNIGLRVAIAAAWLLLLATISCQVIGARAAASILRPDPLRTAQLS
jgi:hypothetical protein